MADKVSSHARSEMMRAVKGANTLPERAVRSKLHHQGFRFRLHRSGLPGRPDLVLPRYKAVVFVHGCFWHRHSGCGYATTPDNRSDFWKEKFRKNVERDKRVVGQLLEKEWRVFIVWECGLRHQADDVLERLATLLKIPECLKYELPELPPRRSD